eukprot:10127892-Karenia_brevis.AAC.1
MSALSKKLSETIVMHRGLARHPQPGRATVFSCPHGHQRSAGPPFDPMRPGKQVWCNRCTGPVAGIHW